MKSHSPKPGWSSDLASFRVVLSERGKTFLPQQAHQMPLQFFFSFFIAFTLILVWNQHIQDSAAVAKSISSVCLDSQLLSSSQQALQGRGLLEVLEDRCSEHEHSLCDAT
jgi:hypothetical protein